VIEKGVEFQSRWATGLMTRPFFQYFGSVKYNFTKNVNSQFLQFGFDSIHQVGDVKILKNKYFLPLGFTYNKYIPLSQYKKLSPLQKQLVPLKSFIAEEPVSTLFRDFSQFNIQDTTKNYSWNELSADINARKADTLKIDSFSNNRIKGTIDLKETKLLFFSIPYDKGWSCMIDGKLSEPQLCNIGFMGVSLTPGKHVIELSFKPLFFAQSLIASLVGLLIYFILIGWKYLSDKKGQTATN
jgi:uncharacterized membrane protein YfhO